jgi:hypothetical protein
MSVKTETIIEEYESEAEARGHVRRRARFDGPSSSPRVMKQAANQADRWGLPYSTLEVIEVTDRNGPDECIDPRGNLDDCLGLCETRLVSMWEDGLGLPRGTFKPL